jgi:hypothetical protein
MDASLSRSRTVRYPTTVRKHLCFVTQHRFEQVLGRIAERCRPALLRREFPNNPLSHSLNSLCVRIGKLVRQPVAVNPPYPHGITIIEAILAPTLRVDRRLRNQR